MTNRREPGFGLKEPATTVMQLRAVLFLLTILLGGVLPAHAQQSPTNSPEAQGHADRVSFEAWIDSLSGDQRRGADYWGQERSKPKPASCLVTDGNSLPEFVSGCQEAQRRLALPDVRRRTEPDYRNGWNADVPVTDAMRPAPPRATTNLAPSTPATTTESWYIGSISDKMCFLTSDTFDGAKTPEEVVANFKKAGIVYLINRNSNGTVTLHDMNDRNNILFLAKDKDFCVFLMKYIH